MGKARNNVVKLNDFVSVKDFGAVGDGVADDTAAIQDAINTGKSVFFPNGKYRITSGLTLVSGSRLFSDSVPFFFQNLGNEPVLNTVPEIYYDGAGGANSFIIRASKVALGTKPVYQADESETLRNSGVSGLFLNGNNKAEYGLYSARAGLGNIYQDLAVTGTKKHGAWFGEFWSAKVSNILCLHNYGCGFTAGVDTFSWAGGNAVNLVEFDTIISYKNGRDTVAWTTANYLDAYGIGLALGRGCNAHNIDAEHNQGVGIMVAPTSGPNRYSNLYTENNCKAGASTERYQTWYQSGVNAFGQIFDGMYFLYNDTAPSGNTNAPRIRITGTVPSPFTAQDAVVFKRPVGGVVFESSFGEYRVENHAAQSTIRYVSHYPQYNDVDTISSSQTTLYVDDAETGSGSGIDTSNYLGSLEAALRIAKVVTSITTIDMSAVGTTPASARVLDGIGLSRRLSIVGGTTGRFNAVAGTSCTFKNFTSELTVSNMAVVERCYVTDSKVVFRDIPIMRMDTGSTAGAAVIIDNSSVEFAGTTVINVSGSSAATKIGISVGGNSRVTFSNAAAGTITGHTANHAIDFDEGSGSVHLSLTTATATWGVSVTYNSGGSGGMVQAPNGVKVGTAAGAFL